MEVSQLQNLLNYGKDKKRIQLNQMMHLLISPLMISSIKTFVSDPFQVSLTVKASKIGHPLYLVEQLAQMWTMVSIWTRPIYMIKKCRFQGAACPRCRFQVPLVDQAKVDPFFYFSNFNFLDCVLLALIKTTLFHFIWGFGFYKYKYKKNRTKS